MRIISKEEFDRIHKNLKSVYEGTSPEWKGRRAAFLPGDGYNLSIEGVDFLVDGDYEHLPVLEKENAHVGYCYKFAGGYTQVRKIYRLSEEYAKANELIYLDRVTTTDGDFALAGSDLRHDLAYYKKINDGRK